MKQAMPAKRAGKKWEKAFSGGTGTATDKARGQKLNSPVFFKNYAGGFRLSRVEDPDDFAQMSFVLKARAKSGGRSFRTVLHVERTRNGSRLVATDGQRLHVAEITKRIAGGDYMATVSRDFIALGEPLDGIGFPEWEKAVPRNAAKSGEIDLGKTSTGNSAKKAAEMSIAVNALNAATGFVVNMRHVAELPKTSWTVYREPGFGKVLVRQRGREDRAFAVFAPVGKAA